MWTYLRAGCSGIQVHEAEAAPASQSVRVLSKSNRSSVLAAEGTRGGRAGSCTAGLILCLTGTAFTSSISSACRPCTQAQACQRMRYGDTRPAGAPEMKWTPGPMHDLRDAGLQLLHRASYAAVLGHVHRK